MALNVVVALIGFALLAEMRSLDVFDRMTPLLLLVLASIMISGYDFGIEGLAAVELPQLRPDMMSAFLQQVGVLMFNALYQKAAAPLSR